MGERRLWTRSWILTMQALAIAFASGPALAQDEEGIPERVRAETPSPDVADEPILMEPADDQDAVAESTDEEVVEDEYAGIEELVVTIRKREERVQEVPAAVTVLDSRTIEAANIQGVADLVDMIPNATVKGQGVTIRGISKSFTSQSPIAQHINGIFKFDDGAYAGQYYDLQAIDVARGPSGTVYGRNATAGATNLVWRKPHSDYQAFGDLTYGSYDRWAFRGGFNLPIFGADEERLLSRFVFQREVRDGYLDNLEEPLRSRDPANADLWYVRGALLSQPIDDLIVELRGYYTQSQNFGSIGRPAVDEFPLGYLSLGGNLFPFNAFNGAEPIPEGERQVRSRVAESTDPFLKIWSIDGQATYGIYDVPGIGSFDVTVLGGHDSTHSNQAIDLDGSELVVLDTTRDIENEQSTVEFRLTSQETVDYSWMFGFFWFQHHRLQPQTSGTPLGPLDTTQDELSSGWAPFFNVEWMPIEDWLQVFGGFRWNVDTIDLDLENFGLGDPPIIDPGQFSGSARYEEPTGEVGVRSKFLDHHMVYAKYARGYKAGDIELVADQVNRIDPEIVNAFEVGSRNDFFDRRLQANLTGFYYDYTDLQVPQILGLGTVTTNAGKADIWGIELELASRPVDAWDLSLAVSYLNATFGEFCATDAAQFLDTSDPGCPAATNAIDGQINLDGNRLEDSPEWKITLLTKYDWDLKRFGVITPVLKFTWTAQYYLRPFNCGACVTDRPGNTVADFTDIDLQQSFTRTDIRLQWRSEGGLFWGEFFVENLEDRTIYSRLVVGPQFTGGMPNRLNLQAPRTFGGRIGFDWGGS